mgnify:CR=1 FL=1
MKIIFDSLEEMKEFHDSVFSTFTPNIDDSIGVLGLSVRSENSLRAFGIETISQLQKFSPSQLKKRIPNLGAVSVKEITDAFDEYKLRLKDQK